MAFGRRNVPQVFSGLGHRYARADGQFLLKHGFHDGKRPGEVLFRKEGNIDRHEAALLFDVKGGPKREEVDA